MCKVPVMRSLCAYLERNRRVWVLLSCATPSAPANNICAPATPLHSTASGFGAGGDYPTCPAQPDVRFLLATPSSDLHAARTMVSRAILA